jgi:hypothetical protein
MSDHSFTAQRLREVVQELAVSPGALSIIQRTCETKKEQGVLKKFSAEYLQKEWINHVLAYRHDKEDFDFARQNTDASYMRYATKRMENPNEPSPRIQDRALKRYGVDFVAMMHQTVWPCEQAYIWLYRNSADDEVAAITHLFRVYMDTKPVCPLFEGFLEHLNNQDATTSLLASDPAYQVSPQAIYDLPGPRDAWEPKMIGFGRTFFKKVLSGMKRGNLRSLAEKARANYRNDMRTVESAAMLAYLKRYSLLHRFSTITYALLQERISMNELDARYTAFLDAVERGDVVTSQAGCDSDFQVFSRELGAKTLAKPIPPSEAARIRSEVNDLPFYWVDNLPDTLKEHDGTVSRVFSQWRNEVTSGLRECPRNFTLDYFAFLVELKI